MTAQTHDDDFREIQLNGKQLVLLFMAASVVSVVIFLCGVLVGRGVRVERTLAAAEAQTQSPTADVPMLNQGTPLVQVPATVDPTVAAPPPTLDDLGDARRPADDRPAAEGLTPAAPRPPLVPAGEKPVIIEKSKVDKAPVAAKPKTEKPVPVETALSGSGYAVQVAALNVRSEADVIAKRLAAKGYAAYVQVPAGGTPSVFRVRIGSFKTRGEAQVVASKIQKEEPFKPWVTR